jgi:hypothetical protein
MGLYLKGKPMTEDAMLVNILEIDPEELEKPFNERPYTCENIKDRLWLWINKKTGKAVITGDEGNGWCIPLIVGNSAEEVIEICVKHSEKLKPKFANLLEVFLKLG